MPDTKKNTAYVFDIALVNASSRPNFKAAPTLATGDVKVSTDDGAFGNITTLPTVTPAAGTNVKVSLSASEMNGDRVAITFIDQTSPKEWDDVHVFINTTTNTIDDVKTETALIVADTGELQTDWVDGGRLDTIIDNILVDTGTTIPGTITTVDTVVDGIQTDLSNATDGLGALKTLIDAVKTETALIVADTNELQTDNVPGLIAALNNIAATDIVSAGAITTLTGAVVNVTTCANNTDMRGTDNAATEAKQDIIDTNIDQIEAAVITNAAGVDIAADIIAIKAETALIVADTNELQTDNVPGLIAALDIVVDRVETDTQDLQTQIGTAGAGLTDLGGMSTAMKAEVNAEADTALTDYDPPTNAEMVARTPTAAQLAYLVDNAALGVPVTFSSGSTTTGVLTSGTGVDGAAPDTTDNHYNGKILVFTDSTLKLQVTDITDYTGSTRQVTFTALTDAVGASSTARMY